MEKDINLQIEEFRQTIIDTVNRSGLPISVAYYILKDVMIDFTDSYKNYLDQAKRREEDAKKLFESKEENEDN